MKIKLKHLMSFNYKKCKMSFNKNNKYKIEILKKQILIIVNNNKYQVQKCNKKYNK